MKVFLAVLIFLSMVLLIFFAGNHNTVIKPMQKTFPAMKPLPMGDNGPLDFQKMETETRYYPWG